MRIYLDTWIIQNWSTGKSFTTEDINFLNSLVSNNDHQIVLSIVHLWEISAREDRTQALQIADLLDRVSNKVWIRNPVDLVIMEIRVAYSLYKNRFLQSKDPYVSGPLHTFPPNMNALELRLKGTNLTIKNLISMILDPKGHVDLENKQKKYISSWAPNNNEIANSFSKKNWEIKIEETLKEQLRAIIIQNQLVPQKELDTDSFIDFLTSHPDSILGFYFSFHVQHYLHRNSSKFKTSTIGDLCVCSIIEYVDQLVLDRKMYNPVKQAISNMKGLKEIRSQIEPKLNKSIQELAGKLNFSDINK